MQEKGNWKIGIGDRGQTHGSNPMSTQTHVNSAGPQDVALAVLGFVVAGLRFQDELPFLVEGEHLQRRLRCHILGIVDEIARQYAFDVDHEGRRVGGAES